MVTKSELIHVFAEAIGTMEGFYKHNTWAQKNNNPGNIRVWGKNPQVGGFVRFETVAKGWGALYTQVDKNLFTRRLTILEFFQGKPGVYGGYAPAADKNNPTHYAEFVRQFVVRKTGLTIADVNVVLATFTFAPELEMPKGSTNRT